MKKKLIIGVLFLTIIALLAACGGGNQAQEPQEQIEDQAQEGADKAQEGAEDIADEAEDLGNVGDDQTPVTMQNGSFEGESERDDRGAYGTITIVVDGGKITSADYEEILADGTPKGPDYQYQTSVEAQPKYEAGLVEKQDPEQVEVIAGATQTWNKFKAAANSAIDKATATQ